MIFIPERSAKHSGNQYKKSSYYRIFRLVVITLISFSAVAGVIMTGICSSMYRKSELEELKETCNMFISYVRKEYHSGGNLLSEPVRNLHNDLMNNSEIMIYVYNSDGKSILSAGEPEREYLDGDMKSSADNNGGYLGLESEGFSYSTPDLLYVTKFALRDSDNNSDFYYISAYSDTLAIDLFTLRILVSYVLMTLITMTAIYVFLKKTVFKYIDHETNFLRICQQYAKGDFSEKLPDSTTGTMRDIAECINSLASDVESSEETSKTFIANVSHELRTPMTTISGFVDGILDGTIPKSRRTEYLVLISKEIKRLRILISSMLNMTRFESGTLTPDFRETNLTDLVIQVVLMFEKKIEQKHLEIEELDSHRLTAVTDPDLMQQVIYNLVENAVKFVNDGGKLSFRFEKQDGICIIGIRNTGEGLKNSEIQQVFDRFYKADSSRGKDTSGLGIGLSISRKIVHLHNGHIVVKSVYGEYTEFQIQIPEDPRVTLHTEKKL